MSTEKAKRRAAQKEAGFVLYPPRCANCDHYQPPTQGSPANTERGGVEHRRAWCVFHGWQTLGTAICTDWQGRGEGGILLHIATTTKT